MTETFRFSSREVSLEKTFSGALLVLAPTPCLVAAVMLARDGIWPSAWAFLVLSLAVEVLVSVERGLAVRAMETFAASVGRGVLALSWPGRFMEIPTEGIVQAREIRGLIGGRSRLTLGLSDGSRLELPPFARSAALAGRLESEGVGTVRRLSFPLAGLAASLAIAAGAILHLAAKAHPALSISALLFALPAIFAGFPLRRCLGPSAAIADVILVVLSALVALVGVAPAAAAQGGHASFSSAGGLPDPGEERSRAIFEAAANGGPETANELMALAASSDPRDRRDATIALGRFSGPAVISAMRGASKDSDADVRRAAASVLGSILDPHAPGILLSIMDSDPDMRVVRAANASLEDWTGFRFRPAGSVAPLAEGDRRMAVDFWRQALYHGSSGEPAGGE